MEQHDERYDEERPPQLFIVVNGFGRAWRQARDAGVLCPRCSQLPWEEIKEEGWCDPCFLVIIEQLKSLAVPAPVPDQIVETVGQLIAKEAVVDELMRGNFNFDPALETSPDSPDDFLYPEEANKRLNELKEPIAPNTKETT